MVTEIFRRFALVVGGVLFACLIIEGFLRLLFPQIFPVHPPGMYTEDADVGYVLSPGFKGYITRSEFKTYYMISQSGLRGMENLSQQPNSYRILVLGDSQAWGFGVADEQTFAAQLDKLLAEEYPQYNIQVLNAGVPGYGTADQLAFLRSRGELLDPDLVIVQFLSVNDLEENHTPALTWAIIQDGMLAHRDPITERQAEIALPVWDQIRRWLKTNSHLARLTLDSIGYLGTRFGLLNRVDALWGENFTAEDAELGTELLLQIAQTASEFGAQSLFLYTTGQAQVVQNTYERPRSAAIVETAAQQARVPWIDAAKQLQQHPDRNQFYYAKDGHWTLKGHQAIAEMLAKKIVKWRLID